MPFHVNQAVIDPETGAAVGIDALHYGLGLGHHFCVREGLVLGAASRDYLIVPPPLISGIEAHFSFGFTCNYDLDVDLYIDTLKTGGTPVYVCNRNGNSSNPPLTTVTHTPNAGDDGTLIGSAKLGTPAGPGGISGGGGSTSPTHWWILKSDSVYLFRLTSATEDSRLTVTFDWYES